MSSQSTSLSMIVTIISIFMQQSHCLRIKYETCRQLAAKAYNDPYLYVTVDPCDTPSFCDYISDDLYETVDEAQGLTISPGSWADTNQHGIDITVAPSVYDSSIDCLYYDESNVIKQGQVHEFSYSAADSESCGCHTEGRTTLCYDCYVWMCSDEQPLLCSTSDTNTNEPYTSDDFCDRETTDLTHDATICNMIDLNNLMGDDDNVLLYGDGVGSGELTAGILWKNKVSYLVIIHLDSTEQIICCDVFDNDGNQIVSAHIVVTIEGDEQNELDDVELMVQKVKSGNFNHNQYVDIVDFVVLYRYDYDDVIKYTLCQFDGESIINKNAETEFVPTISDDSDLWLYYYSSAYLFKSDLFVLFGKQSTSTASIIVFDLEGNVLNEDGVNFEIDYVGSDGFGSSVFAMACGYNASHDICLLNYVDEGSSTFEYSLGAMVAIQHNSDSQAVSISLIHEEMEIDANSHYKTDNAFHPVIVGPQYDSFFIQIGGIHYDCCGMSMSAAVYDLNGNVIVDEFNFNDGSDNIFGGQCYATYQSAVVFCKLDGDELYVFDMNGNALLDNVGVFLSETKLNEYLQDNYSSKYSEFGEITDLSYVKIVPLTSNDFWVVFAADTSGFEHEVILAVKMSIYSECCDVYSEYDEESGESDSDVFGAIGGINNLDIGDPLTIIYICVAVGVVVICVGCFICCVVRRRTKGQQPPTAATMNKSKSMSPKNGPVRYESVMQNEEAGERNVNETELSTLQ